ncbi:dehydrodolichyl diphosphate synthase CPT5, chloroplastic [Beta vulgaris subsp. vulgaris]|uniref:dehydrodolichyl diphosphate synthase CPT5, chloroplastic n=1 Tax=Beta vulgaris subsp. vulgaris TaxID=3555 RepID=UPI00254777EB|nr:dehydrodolichyl diphosphate synthase CPT5, chloroplastic [Beta vulgaris subsp. vulgaris]
MSSSISTLSTGVGNEDSHSSTSSTGCERASSLSTSMLRKSTDEEFSKEGLRKDLIPKHIAIILDGNRRWLKEQGKPLDYMPFFHINHLFADLCLKWGVSAATTFIYSYDNLQRGKSSGNLNSISILLQEANDLIFGQLERILEDNLENYIRKKIRVSLIGERKELPKSLQNVVKHVEEATSREPNAQLLDWRLAVCYAGTRDILQATRRFCEKAKAGLIEPNDIDAASFDLELSTAGTPTPELLIRTGGELRLSNYLIWPLALAEYYFLPIQAPEFTEAHFLDALRSFQQRDRNFGR